MFVPGGCVNCDEYSNLWLYALAWYAHQFGSFFYALHQAAQEYHLTAGLWQLQWTGGRMVV